MRMLQCWRWTDLRRVLVWMMRSLLFLEGRRCGLEDLNFSLHGRSNLGARIGNCTGTAALDIHRWSFNEVYQILQLDSMPCRLAVMFTISVTWR